jgi:2-polyprenyl-3-methyl-5-hydroxy-6-metoxy-1,4-benzoquinol methylase
MGSNLFGDWGLLKEVTSDPGIEIVNSSIEDSNFKGEKFDAIVSSEIIEHLVEPEDMIKEIKKYLKPGGVFLVTAPSLHVQYLSNNPSTYFWSLASTVQDKLVPPFHHMWNPFTDLNLIHHAFSVDQFKTMFRKYFPRAEVTTIRFTHLRKFKIHNLARKLPFIRKWGGLVVAYGKN